MIDGGAKIEIKLPYALFPFEKEQWERAVENVKETGVTTFLCTNVGYFSALSQGGCKLRGDYDLNVFNETALSVAASLGAVSQTLSFELMLSKIRDMKKCIPTEIFIYGKLPLMLLSAPLWRGSEKEKTFTDRKGERFFALKRNESRTEVFNGKVLWLLDKKEELKKSGVDTVRLYFANEGAAQVAETIRAWKDGASPKDDNFTRGLYFRGVD